MAFDKLWKAKAHRKSKRKANLLGLKTEAYGQQMLSVCLFFIIFQSMFLAILMNNCLSSAKYIFEEVMV